MRDMTENNAPLVRRPIHKIVEKPDNLLLYCADYRCSHPNAIGGDQWPDDLRLSDIEDRASAPASLASK
jgi:hypothetical protein